MDGHQLDSVKLQRIAGKAFVGCLQPVLTRYYGYSMILIIVKVSFGSINNLIAGYGQKPLLEPLARLVRQRDNLS